MNLGTKARYAVMAMVDLAGREAGIPVPLTELSHAQEITVPYLEQLFAKLKKQGLVKSVRGPGGGYLLARAAGDIRVAEIIHAVDESTKMTRCEKHTRPGGCMSTRAQCLTHDLWAGLENQIENYLGSISLADVRGRNISKTAIH